MLELLHQELSPDVRANELMIRHTTFKIGGPADFFFEAKTADDATRAARFAKRLQLPLYIFGGGSNLLVSDAGIRGLVVMMANRGIAIDGTRVVADAGAPTGLVSAKSVDAGLAGFEWAVGVPGTIGGAVRGNAGASGGETKDAIESVRALKDGEERILSKEECSFAYRDSIFKREPGWVVLSATFRLAKSADPEQAKAKLRELLVARKQQQPVEYPCAGCVFTNWKPEREDDVEKLRAYLDLGSADVIPRSAGGAIPAGWIIDRAGLKNTRVGGAMFSEKHANFIINAGDATADQVMQLIALAKTRVRNLTHGIVNLREEIEFVGF